MYLLRFTIHSAALVLATGTLGALATLNGGQSPTTNFVLTIPEQLAFVSRLMQYDYFHSFLPESPGSNFEAGER
ncbi:hypothetical protein H4R34_004948, partial [Dimargaris verticillata]